MISGFNSSYIGRDKATVQVIVSVGPLVSNRLAFPTDRSILAHRINSCRKMTFCHQQTRSSNAIAIKHLNKVLPLPLIFCYFKALILSEFEERRLNDGICLDGWEISRMIGGRRILCIYRLREFIVSPTVIGRLIRFVMYIPSSGAKRDSRG